MDLPTTLLLGFIAGVTIVLGLPIGRLRRPAPGLKHFLNAVTIGVLLFLVWDVMSHAWEPVDTALGNYHDHGSSLGPATSPPSRPSVVSGKSPRPRSRAFFSSGDACGTAS